MKLPTVWRVAERLMWTGPDPNVEARIAEFHGALTLFEYARASNDPKALARAADHVRIARYTVSRQLEHLQPTAEQWSRINELMVRADQWLAYYDQRVTGSRA